LGKAPATFCGVNEQGRFFRLYQWLSERARFSRSDAATGLSRTIRTEVTIERYEKTLLVGGAPVDLDQCPLCGQKLLAAKEEDHRSCLPKESSSQARSPFDDAPP